MIVPALFASVWESVLLAPTVFVICRFIIQRFKGHVGLCKDKNNIIEARSINAGVNVFNFTSQNWEKCIRPKYSDDYEKTGWICEPDGRMWYAKSKKKGDYYKNGFYEIEGKKYFFDEDGYLVKLLLLTTNQDGSVEDIVKRMF